MMNTVHPIDLCHSRRCLGYGMLGDDWKIWHRSFLRRFLRVRWWTFTNRSKVTGDGNRIFHSWYRPTHLPLHRSSRRLLEGIAIDHNGFLERSRCSNVRLPSGNTQHTLATDDRGRWTLRRRLQTLVLSDNTKVSVHSIERVCANWFLFIWMNFIQWLCDTIIEYRLVSFEMYIPVRLWRL